MSTDQPLLALKPAAHWFSIPFPAVLSVTIVFAANVRSRGRTVDR